MTNCRCCEGCDLPSDPSAKRLSLSLLPLPNRSSDRKEVRLEAKLIRPMAPASRGHVSQGGTQPTHPRSYIDQMHSRRLASSMQHLQVETQRHQQDQVEDRILYPIVIGVKPPQLARGRKDPS
eukprot:CAMPEP_0194781862 /NCGR_PEP_ID=MMETSP0323_2-20130528/77462_1 /TAXON_ID=2866 ORGANISM="Crypthecodinium cohnii, Strain Seligo" /NCGR_SAMPLE_ID=MMETSP0323_2 /ASSEMBLY_ACC=CAM_ASM_000346 /LENGTH=122 /DNA_ID=CAMNT_0039720479 /DNA_START=136 /DNA_END=500 /DNA_ORIENTATION=+